MKGNSIGLMQGRLLPPVEGRIQAFPEADWVREFMLAREAGIASIEWIYDIAGREANPLVQSDGPARILAQIQESGVKVHSVCADYFMTETLLKGSTEERSWREKNLLAVIVQCAAIGANRVILPFVDSSKLASPEEHVDLVALMHRVSPGAQELRVEIHLETDLGPVAFADLIGKIDRPGIKVNYDSGNSAAHGFKVEEEFAAYGEHIGSVHIKDRVLHGGTVRLGTGGVDFKALRAGLVKIGYDSDFILQVARDVPGDEPAWVRKNAQFVRMWWENES